MSGKYIALSLSGMVQILRSVPAASAGDTSGLICGLGAGLSRAVPRKTYVLLLSHSQCAENADSASVCEGKPASASLEGDFMFQPCRLSMFIRAAHMHTFPLRFLLPLSTLPGLLFRLQVVLT